MNEQCTRTQNVDVWMCVRPIIFLTAHYEFIFLRWQTRTDTQGTTDKRKNVTFTSSPSPTTEQWTGNKQIKQRVYKGNSHRLNPSGISGSPLVVERSAMQRMPRWSVRVSYAVCGCCFFLCLQSANFYRCVTAISIWCFATTIGILATDSAPIHHVYRILTQKKVHVT